MRSIVDANVTYILIEQFYLYLVSGPLKVRY
jgi:hypothetical protein